MTIQEAKNIGGKQILKPALLLFGLYEICLLCKQTSGDFANGILFFISIQMNVLFILFIVLYFTLMFVFGRLMGSLILMKKKETSVSIIFCSLATTFLISILFFLTIFIATYSESIGLSQFENLETFLWIFLGLLVPMISVWFWAGHRIKSKLIES